MSRNYLKNSLENEISELLNCRQIANDRWNDLVSRLNAGEKVDHQVIAFIMSTCNQADFACLSRGIR